MSGDPVIAALTDYHPVTEGEASDLARIRRLAVEGDPWSRSSALHLTASALVVDPATGRVLLRWHDRMQSWLQVGGHGEAGETDPFAIARREAEEETGLSDLTAWPDFQRPLLVHAVIVPVPASGSEPAHHHADLRYLLATRHPSMARPESDAAPLRWLSPAEALAEIDEDNLRITVGRAADIAAGIAKRGP
jgi:8-oxo-dGTP pyrophosphatase MutT (NUDIX family)